uniref:Myosin motor domain-containing protein n=1 Tax=Caenorhabditis japonica TaxID=281687 RepID=A0A8R1E369_CAEJA
MDGGVTLGRGHVFPVQNYKKGARIWHRHPHLVWIGGVLEEDVSFQTRQIRIRLEDDTSVEYDITSLEQLPFLRNPSFLVGKDDLTLLSYLHEPAVLHNLQVRFVNNNSIYTYCGIVLVAINPYADCSHIYSKEIIQVYQGAGKSAREMDPHIFAVAEEAHFDMGAFGKSQSIIVSGESGAGKTVSAKFVMRYLASVAASGSRRDGSTSIEARVLASNPIMESIGNAKTIRNDNSSRFGKFIQINFCDRSRRIVGAEMKTYLLEKSRLVFQAPGERNYHIFYQLCAARNHQVLKDLHLGPCESYAYLTQGGDSRIPGVNDCSDFDELLKALNLLGFEDKQTSDVFRLLAGLLLLGNVHFENGEVGSAVSARSNQEIARLCAEIWEISEQDLRVWLTRREIRAVNEVVAKPLTKNEAIRSRDALTKMLYAHLFGWLVNKINEALNEEENTNTNINMTPNRRKRMDRFIGVLDIYGFETFDVNSFEQFSINYANEKLQQQFNQHVFKLEQEEYVREEIEWVRVDFHDNQPAIDLIEGPVGMINLLDEQCKRLNGSDSDWLSQLSNSGELKKNPQLAFPRVRSNDFIVRHFAADVTYTTDGFVEKNRDAIGEQLLDVVVASRFDFIRNIVGPAASSGSTPGKRATKKTVASQFRDSLKELMQVLCSTRPHYVRCIKPNDSKISFDFEPKRAIQQLRACGVLETVRISAAGFPSRYPYDEFARRYRVLYTKEAALWRDKPKQFAELACQQCLEDGKYALGKTKIFLRTGQVAVLERVRLDTLAAAAVIIQKTWKGFLARRKYETMRRSLLIVQASLKAFLGFRRIKYLQMHRAAITMQSAVRGFIQKRKYEKIRNAVIGIQAAFKANRVRRYVEKLRYEKSAITIQAAWRGYSVRREQIARRKKVVMVQCAVRKWLAKRRLRELKIEARSVGHLQKLNTGLENKIIELQMRLDTANGRTKEETEKLATASKDLEKTKAELAMMEAERLTLLEARHRVEVLQEEVERLETECDLKEAQRGGMETKVVELQSRLDQMQSESVQTIAELTEQLEKAQAKKAVWDEERQTMEDELKSERTARHALDGEVAAMREQLMKNVDIFESATFQKRPSPRKNREEVEASSRTTSNLSQLTGSLSADTLGAVPPPITSRGSPEAQLNDMAMIFEQLKMINDLRQRNEHCQRETERMKAILEASALIETLDKKTSLKAFESIRVGELEGAYNRLKSDMERIVSSGQSDQSMRSVFERIMEENERLRDEAVELRSMLSSHFERQSVAGSSGYRRSPRPDSGHCSGADSEDGSSSADLEEDLCIERQCRQLKNLAENLTKMLTNQNLEIERLQQQLRFSESQIVFVSF